MFGRVSCNPDRNHKIAENTCEAYRNQEIQWSHDNGRKSRLFYEKIESLQLVWRSSKRANIESANQIFGRNVNVSRNRTKIPQNSHI